MLLFFFGTTYAGSWASRVAQWIKNTPAMQEMAGDVGLISGLGRTLEEGMKTRFNILAWRIPGTVGPGGLQSMGSQRVRHN